MADTSAQRPLVAFLGPPSSFTHQATRSTFSEQDYDFVPVGTIKDVFDAVQAGGATYGVVPFENSTHGVVTFTLDSLADRHNTYGDLAVCGEVYIGVHHFLLGYKQPSPPPSITSILTSSSSSSSSQQPQQQQQQPPGEYAQELHAAISSPGTSTPTQGNPNPPRPRSKPLHPLGHIQRIYSHPQAFGQTSAFLSTYLRGVDAVDVSSTSKAAETASRDPSGASAAIAGEMAADVFGLDVLARCIEDRDDNTTRFFVLRRGDAAGVVVGGHMPSFGVRSTAGGGGGGSSGSNTERTVEGHKSLVSFTVPHRSPGALATVLDVFKKYGLNLTSINSVPSLIQPFQYLFFVEFEGSMYEDPDGRIKGALEEVGRVAEGWRWLGSWKSQL